MTKDAQLLTSQQVADLLSIGNQTPTNWRHRGQSPVYYKMGREVRYKLSDVFKWQRRALREVAPTA